jgi:hypothetical protein
MPLPAAPRRTLQFAKAGSAAKLPQQGKNNSADVQRAALSLETMYLADGFSASRHRRRMFEPFLRQQHLRQNTSAPASSGPFRGKTKQLLRP